MTVRFKNQLISFDFYSNYFGTFYRTPTTQRIENWDEQVKKPTLHLDRDRRVRDLLGHCFGLVVCRLVANNLSVLT